MIASILPLAAPYIARSARAQAGASVKIGTVLAGTTMAAQLLPKQLAAVGVQAEVLPFTSLTLLMQAIAAGNIQMGYGGINAAISIAGRGMPMTLLANVCDGGWRMVGKTDIKDLKDLKGKKVAVQAGNMCHVALAWKLNELGISKDVELVFMPDGTPRSAGSHPAKPVFRPRPCGRVWSNTSANVPAAQRQLMCFRRRQWYKRQYRADPIYENADRKNIVMSTVMTMLRRTK